jgi:hypothetical protein
MARGAKNETTKSTFGKQKEEDSWKISAGATPHAERAQQK